MENGQGHSKALTTNDSQDPQLSEESGYSSQRSTSLTQVQDGNYIQPHFGQKIQQDCRSITNNVYNITNLNSQPTQSEQAQSSSGEQHGGKRAKLSSDEENEDCIVLEKSIYLFPKRKINKMGNIYEGEQRSRFLRPRAVAIKRLDFDDDKIKEAMILRDLACHQNVVQFIAADSFWEGKFDFIYIAMELCRTENLYDYIVKKRVPFDSNLAISWGKQILEGLNHVHKKKVAHRDLKPHNVLLSLDEPPTLKIADFGLSMELEHGRSQTNQSTKPAGTDGYRAPETYLKNMLSRKGDIFSLGLTIFFVWSNGEHPFGSEPDLWNYNIKKNINRDLSKCLIEHNGTKRLLEKMLQFEKKDRPTTEQILAEWCFPTFAEPAIPAVVHEEAEEVEEENTCKPGEEVSSTTEPSIILFNRSSGSVLAFNPYATSEACMKDIDLVLLTAMQKQTYSAVSIGDSVYVLLWRKFMYVGNPLDPDPFWRRIEPMAEGHGEHPPVAVLDGAIYVCGGGWDGWTKCYKENWLCEPVTSAAEKYVRSQDQWFPLDHLNVARRHNAVVAAEGCIYTIGGVDKACNILDSVEKYTPLTNTWKEVAPLNTARCKAAAVAYNSKIYVFGGNSGQSDLADVEVYDPTTNTWTGTAEMLSPRSMFRAMVVKDKIFVVGGDSYFKSTIDVFNPRKKTWKKKATISDTIEAQATLVFNC